ncbi:MAG: hypothetical protein RIB47_05185 [Cyclobacteriaceae bacterium]
MKKLDDIPKKSIYEVPEGYFDKLPGIIQSRIADEKKVYERPAYFQLALKYALPVLALIAVLFFVVRNDEVTGNPEEMLATISSEELAIYLQESDLTTDELLEEVDLNELDLEGLNMELDLYPELDSEDLLEYTDDFLIEI